MGGAGTEVRQTGGGVREGAEHDFGNLIGNVLRTLGGGEELIKGPLVMMAPEHGELWQCGVHHLLVPRPRCPF